MTTYATLKSDVADYMARDDLTAVIPTLVRLAESRIRDMVRVNDMETTTDLTISGRTTALPTGLLGIKRLIIDSTTYRQLEFVPADEGWRDLAYITDGEPQKYTIEGSNLIVFPAPATSVTGKLTYLGAYDALVNDADTNWLLANAYDVYLYGTLAEAKGYIEDDEQAAKWLDLFNQSCARANRTANNARRGAILVRGGNAP